MVGGASSDRSRRAGQISHLAEGRNHSPTAGCSPSMLALAPQAPHLRNKSLNYFHDRQLALGHNDT